MARPSFVALSPRYPTSDFRPHLAEASRGLTQEHKRSPLGLSTTAHGGSRTCLGTGLCEPLEVFQGRLLQTCIIWLGIASCL